MGTPHRLAPVVNDRRPKLLDLFCGAGGAGAGYERAGFEVVGVDTKRSPRSPHPIVVTDALCLTPRQLRKFDAIHASPPCQRYSPATKGSGTDAWQKHADLIAPTRELLASAGRPYVIENVPGSPLRNAHRLCGSMFEGLRVRRHRFFETNWAMITGGCGEHQRVYDHSGRHAWRLLKDGAVDPWEVWLTVAGHMPFLDAHADAMGIDWMNRSELAQAVPPAYTEYIGRQLIEFV